MTYYSYDGDSYLGNHDISETNGITEITIDPYRKYYDDTKLNGRFTCTLRLNLTNNLVGGTYVLKSNDESNIILDAVMDLRECKVKNCNRCADGPNKCSACKFDDTGIQYVLQDNGECKYECESDMNCNLCAVDKPHTCTRCNPYFKLEKIDESDDSKKCVERYKYCESNNDCTHPEECLRNHCSIRCDSNDDCSSDEVCVTVDSLFKRCRHPEAI